MDALPFIDLPILATRHTDPRKIAQQAVQRARKSGVLPTKAECAKCSKSAEGRYLHYHHESYDEPRRVTPLCHKCHRTRHSELGWGNSSGLPKASERKPRVLTADDDVDTFPFPGDIYTPEFIAKAAASTCADLEAISKTMGDDSPLAEMVKLLKRRLRSKKAIAAACDQMNLHSQMQSLLGPLLQKSSAA